MNKKNCIYVTYDHNLKQYLHECNIEDILYGLHPKTNRMFWVFERHELLQKKLDQWFNNDK